MGKAVRKKQTKIILYSILMVIIVILGIFIFINSKVIKTYKEISFNELTDLVDSGDKFILFIGSDSCSHCTIYKETLNIVIKKHHVLVNYIDISKISDEEIAYIKARFAFSATPTTVFIGEGKDEVSERVLTKKVGSLDSNKVIDLFKEYGYIKE